MHNSKPLKHSLMASLIITSVLFCFFEARANEENCYGDQVNEQAFQKVYSYSLTAAPCIKPQSGKYPLDPKNTSNPFLGFSSYEWQRPYNSVETASIEKNLLNCGSAKSPCYCDASLKDSANFIFSEYCCPTISGCRRPTRDKKGTFINYENRPFYLIYKKNGDLEIKGNLISSGDSNLFLNAYTKISGLSTGFLKITKNWFDVTISQSAHIARHLIFGEKNSTLKIDQNIEISKAKKNKIIYTNLNGKKQASNWQEFDATNIGAKEFSNPRAIASNGNFYWLLDKGNRRITKVDSNRNSTSFGERDWAWDPEGIDVDSANTLFITSSLDEPEKNAKEFFRITSPIDNTVYQMNEKVILSWSRFPGADSYTAFFKKNDDPTKQTVLSQNKTSVDFDATTDRIGSWNYQIGAFAKGKLLSMTSNTLSFRVVAGNPDLFRITNPTTNSHFTLGDSLTFAWDRLSNAKSYQLVFLSKDAQGQTLEKTVYQGGANYKTLESDLDSGLLAGNYQYKIVALDKNDKKITETSKSNLKLLSENNQDGYQSHNIFKIAQSGWDQFVPRPDDFKKSYNYNLLREYLINTGDKNALSFLKPRGISQFGNHLYIADSGHKRIVRLNKNLTIPETIISSLQNLNGQADQNLINQIADYWQVLDLDGNTLNNPQDVFVDGSGVYIADSLNKRILFQASGACSGSEKQWRIIGDATYLWEPKNVYKQGNYLYVSDSINGRIVRINMSGCGQSHSFFSVGLKLNDSFYIFGKRGQKRFEFNYPTDLTYFNGNFIIPDSIPITGYSLTVGNASAASGRSSLVSLYENSYNNVLNPFDNYSNEFDSSVTARGVQTDNVISLFNGEANHWVKWQQGPGISHCQSICSEAQHCGGCDGSTCDGQWDWEANAPSCTYSTWVIKGCTSCSEVPNDPSGGKTIVTNPITNTNGSGSDMPSTPTPTTHTECVSYDCCIPTTLNCHVGYAVGFNNDYGKEPSPNDASRTSPLNQNNLNLSKVNGWPEYVEN